MAKTKRVLWLHTQPEHYFNLLIDALNAASEIEYIAGFMSRGPGLYKDVPVPAASRSLFLRPKKGMEGRPAAGFRGIHEDWQEDIAPLDIHAGIIAGYAGATQRQFIHTLHRQGKTVLMMSDSNIRSQRGHGWGPALRRRVKRLALGPIIRDTDVLLTMNMRGVAYWRYFGAPKSKIVLCPFYADYARIEGGRRSERSAVLARFPIPQDKRIILTAARLVPAKGLDLMLDAFRQAGLADRGYIYCIAGTGPLEAELKARAGDALDRSIFFLGFTQPSDLMPLLCHSDLFVLPSVYEPHGIVIGEAAAAGTPLLCSDVCGAAPDLVVAGRSGLMFHSGQARDLLGKLRVLTADPARLRSMRPTTRAVFEEWFGRTNPVKVVDLAVKRLLGPQ